ncbi:MAG: BMP family ABC transporter substrate-binding protein [Erysipelothrix sp.]|nr:BMP family ABC transporter substrate-binding protein [Erysipelothrix sp.]
MKKTFKLLFATLLAVALLVACGGTGNGDTNGDDETKFKVVAVFDSGGQDDKSFNQSTWEGIQRFLKDNNLSDAHAVNLSSKDDGSDYVSNLDRAATEGADMVIAIGFLFENALAEVAPKHPDVHFLFIDGIIPDVANIHSTSFAEHEGSYLVGYVAGERAKADGSNRVGFVGGFPGPVIGRFQAGFEQGVWAANPDAVIDVQYAMSFDDTAMGSSLATKLYDAGSNIVFHAAGNVGNGVISEALNRENVWVIGVDRDQYLDGMDEKDHSVVLTSMLKRVDVAAYDFIKEYFENDGKVSTELYTFNMKNEGITAETTEDRNLTSEEIATIKDLEEKIKAGTITVTEDPVIPDQTAWKLSDVE